MRYHLTPVRMAIVKKKKKSTCNKCWRGCGEIWTLTHCLWECKIVKLNIQQMKSMASSPITSWQIGGAKVEIVTDFIFLGFKFAADSDCSHEIPRWLRWWSICLQCGRPRFYPWVRKILWRRKWQPTLVFLPGKSHGWKSLVVYSPWGHKELDMTEPLHLLLGRKAMTNLC